VVRTSVLSAETQWARTAGETIYDPALTATSRELTRADPGASRVVPGAAGGRSNSPAAQQSPQQSA
jgi:hypothetical protein